VNPADNAVNAGSETQQKPQDEPHCSLSELVGQLRAQTLALNALSDGIVRLAQSNEALVDAMYQDEEGGGPSSGHLGSQSLS